MIDSDDILSAPDPALRALCAAIDIPFDDAMLSWRAGKRDSDGIWAKHWYASVEKSSEFMPYNEDETAIPEHLRPVLEECNALYQQMEQYRLLK